MLQPKKQINSTPTGTYDTKKIVHIQSGVTNDRLGDGFYIYSRKPTEPGFNPVNDREFITTHEYKRSLPRTPQFQSYMRSLQSQQPNTAYAMGGDLNQFNEGGTHSQNPLGGIPQGQGANGQMNTVEQGETKQGDFVYSDRIILTPKVIQEFGIPKSLAGKTVANATKIIDSKFKDRNDKISVSTKNSMLAKLNQAQETIKAEQQQLSQAQEANSTMAPEDMMGGQVPQGMEEYGEQPGQPDEQEQMAYGGYQNKMFLGGDETTQGLDVLGGALGGYGKVATTGLSLGKEMFGKSSIDDSGASDTVDTMQNGATQALSGAAKGAKAGSMFGPIGTGVGVVVGGVSGLVGANKDRQALQRAAENRNLRQYNTKFSDYALGGNMFAGGGPIKNYHEENNPYFTTNPGLNIPLGQETVSSNKFVKPKYTADYDTNIIKNLHDSLGITPDMPGYGKEWGKKSNQAYYDSIIKDEGYMKSDPSFGKDFKTMAITKKSLLNGDFGSFAQKRYGITPEGYKFTPETPNIPQKEITPELPTASTASFEKYYNENTPKPNPVYGLNKEMVERGVNDLGRLAPVIGNAFQKISKPEFVNPIINDRRFNPEYVDERQLQNTVAGQDVYGAIQNANMSQGATTNAILGAGLNKNKAMSDAYMQAANQNRAMNLQGQSFDNSIDEANIGRKAVAEDLTARNKAAYDTARSEKLNAITKGIGDVSKENMQRKIMDKVTGYNTYGEYIKDPNTGTWLTKDGKPASIGEVYNAILKGESTNGKALGGYLMNKRKK